MSRLTKSGTVSQRDINKLMELSDENQFGMNDVYYKLKEYEDLEEKGLLIKLPCEIGSKVYSICTGVMIEFEMTLELYAKRHDMFGITMFTTKEGAEQGLKDWRNKLCNI